MNPVAYRWRHKGVHGNGEWNFSAKPVEGHAFDCEGLIPAERRTGPQERRDAPGSKAWVNGTRRMAFSDRRKQTFPTTTAPAGKPIGWINGGSSAWVRPLDESCAAGKWEPLDLRPTISEARLKGLHYELRHRDFSSPDEWVDGIIRAVLAEIGVEVTK